MGSPRRTLTVLASSVVLVVLAGCGGARPSPGATGSSAAPSATSQNFQGSSAIEVAADEIRALEEEFGARVGASALDPLTGRRVDYNADDRFGYASTIKAVLAAHYLIWTLDDDRTQTVTWTEEDVEDAGYAPVTSEHVEDGLTLDQLAEAAVRESDNLATNLLFEKIGGPGELDRAFGRWGDTETEVVGIEPDLNTIEPGSTDDTTTAGAFTDSLAKLTEDQEFPAEKRELLIGWMSGNASGNTLIRAGAPDGWIVADKSGGAGAIRNDIAFVTAPGSEDPIVITILTEKTDADEDYEDELVARVAESVLGAFE